jgi:hydroxymethylpyrimidine/phosphomethylpyrimidine kinase
MSIPKALTIAGSDSGGGAGIQADLKTFSAYRVFGMSVITAVTAQNSLGMQAVECLPPALVARQLSCVLEDFGADAAKCGMLGTAAIVEAVAAGLRARPVPRLVIDPVMAATSGDALLEPDAVGTVTTRLLPLALVVTPNLPEAEALAGMPVSSRADMEEAARRIHKLGPRHVLVKGGHLKGDAVDLLYNGRDFTAFQSPRIESEERDVGHVRKPGQGMPVGRIEAGQRPPGARCGQPRQNPWVFQDVGLVVHPDEGRAHPAGNIRQDGPQRQTDHHQQDGRARFAAVAAGR